jgi:hypothetical protein
LVVSLGHLLNARPQALVIRLHLLALRFHIRKSIQHARLHTEVGLSKRGFLGDWTWHLSRGHELGQVLRMSCAKHPKEEETNHLGRHRKRLLVELLL